MRRVFIFLCMGLALHCLSGCAHFSKPPPENKPRQAAEGVLVDGMPVGLLTAGEIRELVYLQGSTRGREPVNAGFNSETLGITPEQKGFVIDVEATVQRILDAPANSTVLPVQLVKEPFIKETNLHNSLLIGKAETPLLDKGQARMHNVKRAAQAITNAYVLPGGTFSFNSAIGNPTVDRGYMLAPIIENGQRILGEGGGVCQISSTLYAAALDAYLPIVERHMHSIPVNYIPVGMDATTSDDKDFKFRNNRQNVLILHILVTSDNVKANIWEYVEGNG